MRAHQLFEGRRGAFMRDELPGVLPATPDNIAAAKAFVFEKWKERAAERYEPAPTDLSWSCKFSSLFARAVFGGKLAGNYDHQFVIKDGETIDLNLDAADVKALQAPHSHDDIFWGSPDHKASVRSCAPRVEAWVREFIDGGPRSS